MRVQSVIDTLCIVIGGARIRMKFSRRVFALSLYLYLKWKIEVPSGVGGYKAAMNIVNEGQNAVEN